MDPRLGLGIHQYSLEFWTFTIEKVGKLCTLLMRREGGKYTKVPPSSWWGGKLIDVSIVVGGDADVVVSMWMPRWPPVQHIVFSRALAFEQPEPESRYSVAEAGLADARGCAAGADRTCADRSSIVRSTLQLTSANLSVPLRGKVPPSRWPLTGSLHSGVTVLHRAVGQLWSCCVKLWKRSDGHSMPLSRQSRCQVSQRRASAKLASRRWVWWDL